MARTARSGFAFRPTIAWLAVPPLFMIAPAFADGLPGGATVTAGRIVVSQPAPNALVVSQSTDRGVVRWNNFSLSAGNRISFVQPGSGSATLNVVTGTGATTLAGQLTANGSVFIVNPYGIDIGPTGRINVGAGFVASTLGISDDDFMQGRLHFAGTGGWVVNRGYIRGGSVALLGGNVSNEGTISAPLGRVGLGSASAATLDLGGDGFLQVLLPASATAADGQALVSNSGVIQADGGTVVLKASTVRDAVRNAVNMPGSIRASSVSGHDGEIVLSGGDGGAVAVSGRLDASAAAGGSRGGRIDVSGGAVALAGAALTAAGVDQGGTIRVGGAFQGGRTPDASSPPITNAATTTVDARSSIDVSAAGTAGAGGTAVVWSDKATAMQGSLDARGALSGGHVEISSASKIQSVDLSKVKVGAGGSLTLDPANIGINDSGSGSDAGTTYVSSASIVDQLSAGTNVSLLSSNDIVWSTGIVGVTPTYPTVFGGNLDLTAGRSISLSGAFTTRGSWTLTANAPAAAGVVDAERQAGHAAIDLGNAAFINSNERLTVKILGGTGNTFRDVDGITMPQRYDGQGLTAYVDPSIVNGDGSSTRIVLGTNYSTVGDIVLTGNLIAGGNLISLSAPHVTWTNEATGILGGDGKLQFVESGVLTRYGQAGYGPATRLALGDATPTTATRVYGDADPTLADIGTPQLHVIGGGTAPDALGTILAAGSLVATGPGLTASVGSYSMPVRPDASAIAFNVYNPYWIDLTPASTPLAVTARHVTPTVTNASTTYGSAAAVVSLANLVNGDVPTPVATLNTTAGITMAANGAGFGFGGTAAPAGTSSFSITGLSGTGAGNYVLDVVGASGTLTVAQKPLTWFTSPSSQTYGTLAAMPSGYLSGAIGTDDVGPTVGLTRGGTAATLTDRLPAGSYAAQVVGLTGAAAGNYTIASSGNAPGTFTVNPKPITWSVADAASTYGTLATLGAASFTGVLSGDVVTGAVGATRGGNAVTLAATSNAGTYGEVASGFGGASIGNYTVSGGTPGTLTISPKALTYTGSASSQVYGATTIASPSLQGVVGSDAVSGVAALTTTNGAGSRYQGGSGALPVGDWQAGYSGLTGAGAANYVLASAGNLPNSVTITPRSITYQAGSATGVYGDPYLAVPQGATLSGLVAGDVISGGATFVTADGSHNNPSALHVGSYLVGVETANLEGDGARNYVIASSGNTRGSLVVTQRPLTWSVGGVNATTIYGELPSNPAYLNGVLSNDAVFATVGIVDTNGGVAHVGTHAVGVTGLYGPSVGDYTLTAGGSTGTTYVLPRPINYVFTAPQTSVYGTVATPAQPFAVGTVNGDSVRFDVLTGTLANGAGIFPLAAKTPAGTYTLTARLDTTAFPDYILYENGTNGINYPGRLTVQPKPVAFTTLSTSSTYGTAATPAATLSGLVAGDAVSAGAVTLNATGVVPGIRTDVGSYAIDLRSLTGTDSANYVIAPSASTMGTLTVTPKTVTYHLGIDYGGSILGQSLVYGTLAGGGQPGVSVAIDGKVYGDDVGMATSGSLVPLSGSGAMNVGTYSYTASGALQGSRARNYVLATSGNTATGSFAVTPAPVDVFPRIATTNNFYADTSAIYGNAGGLSLATPYDSWAVRSGDAVTANAAISTPAGNLTTIPGRLGVGIYTIVATPFTGADGGNYMPQVHPGSLTVTQRPITWTTSTASYVYGTTASIADATTRLNGVLAGDTVTVGTVVTGPNGAVGTPVGRSNAGRYNAAPTPIGGADAANYVLMPYSPYGYLPVSTNGYIDIVPRTLGFTVDPATLSFNYGTTLQPGTLSGVLAGDTVTSTSDAAARTIHGSNASGSYAIDGSNLLQAGSYTFTASLSGASAGNYQLPAASFGAITVAPKPITATTAAQTATYGSNVAPSVVLTGLVGNDSFTPVVKTTDASGVAVTYTAATNAGSYTNKATGLVATAGRTDLNYVVLDTPSASAPLTISPKRLSLIQPTGDGNSIYGDSINLGALSGVLFNDDVGVTVSGTSMPGARLVASGGQLYYTGLLDVASYRWSAALAGAKAGNYSLPASTGGSFAVTPRSIVWAVANASGQHGNYQACDTNYCDPWVPGVTLGKATFEGLVPGQSLSGTVGLLDFAGNPVTMSASTPRGGYFEVVSGFTGVGATKAGNYRIADTGSKPGLFTVTPQWLSWTVTSGLYVQGTGAVVGTPGVPTLIGPNGPFADPTVTPVVQIYGPNGAEVKDLVGATAGRTNFYVTGLAGTNAGDFQVLPYYHAGSAAPNAGTFDVYPANLGQGLIPATQTPIKIPTYTPAPVVTAPPLSGYTSSNTTGQMLDFGRNIDATGAAGQSTQSGTSGAASGAASGTTGSTTGLGNGVDLSTQASGAVSALIKYGVSGVNVRLTADAHVDVTIQSGPGYVMIGAQGDAYAVFNEDKNGITLSGQAIAGVSAQGGAQGSLGAAGSGSVSATTSVFAFARHDESATVKDGVVTEKLSQQVGVGASAGANAGMSGSVGSVNAGATVYSPGVLGGQFSYSGGYSNGALSMSLDIGAEIGIGGLDLKFAFKIDPKELVSKISDGFNAAGSSPAVLAIASAFGMDTSMPTHKVLFKEAITTVESMQNDPSARFQYLLTHPAAMTVPDSQLYYSDASSLIDRAAAQTKFFESYKTLLSDTAALAKTELDRQQSFTTLLQTDPAAALAYSHANQPQKQDQNAEVNLRLRASAMGLKLTVAGDHLSYVNK